jgi:hypothetical protein
MILDRHGGHHSPMRIVIDLIAWEPSAREGGISGASPQAMTSIWPNLKRWFG